MSVYSHDSFASCALHAGELGLPAVAKSPNGSCMGAELEAEAERRGLGKEGEGGGGAVCVSNTLAK